MFSVLFNPNGRIGPRTFLRGVVVVLAAMIVINVISIYAGPVGAALGLLSLAFPYVYLCLYGKRLHDAGKSAWWFLLFLLAYVVLDGVGQMILMPFLTPQAAELQEQMQLLIQQGQIADAFAFAPEIAKAGLFTSLVSLFISNAILGAIAARLKSDPGPNAYGPPEGLGHFGDQTGDSF